MRERSYLNASIATELLKPLLRGDLSPLTVASLEAGIGAYAGLKPETFGGILFHSDGRGPEKPYFFPDERDLLPQIQAVARIGVQYQYWDMLSKVLETGTIDFANIDSMSILVLNIESPGKIHKVLGRNQILFGLALNLGLIKGQVNLIHDEKTTGELFKKPGAAQPDYQAYVHLVNFGGDADFWGAWENSIFPMRVQVNRPSLPKERQYGTVQSGEVGINESLTQTAWDSWSQFDIVKGNLFHEAVKRLVATRQFHQEVVSCLNTALAKGVRFTHGAEVARTLIKGHVLDDEILSSVISRIDPEMKRIVFKEGHGGVIDAAKNLSDSLFLMYQTARKFCKSGYPY